MYQFPRVVLWYFYFFRSSVNAQVTHWICFFHAKKWFKGKSVMPPSASLLMHFLRAMVNGNFCTKWPVQYNCPEDCGVAGGKILIQVIKCILLLHPFYSSKAFHKILQDSCCKLSDFADTVFWYSLIWKWELMDTFISGEKKVLAIFKHSCSYLRLTGFQFSSPAG